MTDFVAHDPSGRFARYDTLLGTGSFKRVYRAVDLERGQEVAWNSISTRSLSVRQLEKLLDEVRILETLDHPNIIQYYASWAQDETFVFVTELAPSGTLRSFVERAKGLKSTAIIEWLYNIAEGLVYLHSRDPPVIHRDLKCDNIFFNGNNGKPMIGDLGLATVRTEDHAQSVIGTPEFMAPELYEEKYDERVDVYALGMCALEMVTLEYPYSECHNVAQIYRRVSAGILPESLNRVMDSDLRDFIQDCILPAEERPTSEDLLTHPLFEKTSRKKTSPVVSSAITAVPAVGSAPAAVGGEEGEVMGEEMKGVSDAPGGDVPPKKPVAVGAGGGGALVAGGGSGGVVATEGGSTALSSSRPSTPTTITHPAHFRSGAGSAARDFLDSPHRRETTGASRSRATSPPISVGLPSSMVVVDGGSKFMDIERGTSTAPHCEPGIQKKPLSELPSSVLAVASMAAPDCVAVEFRREGDSEVSQIQFEVNPAEEDPREIAEDIAANFGLGQNHANCIRVELERVFSAVSGGAGKPQSHGAVASPLRVPVVAAGGGSPLLEALPARATGGAYTIEPMAPPRPATGSTHTSPKIMPSPGTAPMVHPSGHMKRAPEVIEPLVASPWSSEHVGGEPVPDQVISASSSSSPSQPHSISTSRRQSTASLVMGHPSSAGPPQRQSKNPFSPAVSTVGSGVSSLLSSGGSSATATTSRLVDLSGDQEFDAAMNILLAKHTAEKVEMEGRHRRELGALERQFLVRKVRESSRLEGSSTTTSQTTIEVPQPQSQTQPVVLQPPRPRLNNPFAAPGAADKLGGSAPIAIAGGVKSVTPAHSLPPPTSGLQQQTQRGHHYGSSFTNGGFGGGSVQKQQRPKPLAAVPQLPHLTSSAQGFSSNFASAPPQSQNLPKRNVVTGFTPPQRSGRVPAVVQQQQQKLPPSQSVPPAFQHGHSHSHSMPHTMVQNPPHSAVTMGIKFPTPGAAGKPLSALSGLMSGGTANSTAPATAAIPHS